MPTLPLPSYPITGWRLLAVGTPLLGVCVVLVAIRNAGEPVVAAWELYRNALPSRPHASDVESPNSPELRAPIEEWHARVAQFSCRHNGSQLLDELSRHASESGLGLDSVVPEPAEPRAPALERRLLAIHVKGSFHTVLAFLHRLEQSNGALRTHRLELSRAQTDADLTMALTIETFCIDHVETIAPHE